jgi:hypothetical protein
MNINIDPYADDCIPIFIMLRIHVDKIEYYCAHGYVCIL